MITEKKKLYMKEYRKQEGYKERQAGYYQKWYKKHGRERPENYYKDIILVYKNRFPEKHKARWQVYEAIKSGKLTKPSQCIICNKERYLNAHHKDYSQPLDVLWICASCHKKLHLGLIVI